MEWDDLENALAWFKSAPGEWIDSGRQNLEAAAQWIWEVIQGDFNDEQTTAQVVTGTVVSMIPFVDQVCDVRDVVANCRKINEDTSNSWAWVALVLTLIGLFPTFGSLAKGCLKILFAYGRKTVFRTAKATMDSGFWNASRPFVEAGIGKLNEFLQRPAVRRALRRLRWHNPYRELATLVRETAGSLNIGKVLTEFDKVIRAFRSLVDKVKRWGPDSLGRQADELTRMVARIRGMADAPLRRVLGPVSDWLNRLARRLEIESDMAYRASTNSVNPHHYRRVSNDAEEMQSMGSRTPAWADASSQLRYRPLRAAPSQAGWPDISGHARRPMSDAYKTFHSARAATIPEGEVLYRVVDPASGDNSICWMRKAEFDKLKSKDGWRRHFAVKANWNANGEYVTYTVPRGGLRVWEGPAASQAYKDASGATRYTLEGGYSQIVLDPAHLDRTQLGRRRPTGWGYTSFGGSVSMVGVPTLKNNWYGN
ncbi:hypothetical protein [Luteimonas suaedae]|uniref:hypothetical protein n=1 Tax=Luteimonas suaedae TaxID=2605430 RepID=UPI0011EE1CFF|nr:hypothetical protein [Luteimonas suaedae]